MALRVRPGADALAAETDGTNQDATNIESSVTRSARTFTGLTLPMDATKNGVQIRNHPLT
jgi:hypothetical protein